MQIAGIPDLIVLDTANARKLTINTVFLTDCAPSWSAESDLISQSVRFALLYLLPLLFVSAAYYQIARVLWRSARLPQPPAIQMETRRSFRTANSGNLSQDSNPL